VSPQGWIYLTHAQMYAMLLGKAPAIGRAYAILTLAQRTIYDHTFHGSYAEIKQTTSVIWERLP
jgi:hypothetical protein